MDVDSFPLHGALVGVPVELDSLLTVASLPHLIRNHKRRRTGRLPPRHFYIVTMSWEVKKGGNMFFASKPTPTCTTQTDVYPTQRRSRRTDHPPHEGQTETKLELASQTHGFLPHDLHKALLEPACFGSAFATSSHENVRPVG